MKHQTEIDICSVDECLTCARSLSVNMYVHIFFLGFLERGIFSLLRMLSLGIGRNEWEMPAVRFPQEEWSLPENY